MGCSCSVLERKQMVSNCKGRIRCMERFVKASQAFSTSHAKYMSSVRGTSYALFSFGLLADCPIVDRLYAWEKKLYQEAKTAVNIRIMHEKKVGQARKKGLKGGEYMNIEKSKEIEKLESLLMVASEAVEITYAEIIRVRDKELYPQLLEIVEGLIRMWREMYECHKVQTNAVKQLKLFVTTPLTDLTSEIHRESTLSPLSLDIEVQQWYLSFCNLVKAQQNYVDSLTEWLRLCPFQFNNAQFTNPRQNTAIYSFCEEWQQGLDSIPDKVASKGIIINSFLTAIHENVVQQAKEKKQRKKSEGAMKELKKHTVKLRTLQRANRPYDIPDISGSRKLGNDIAEQKAIVETLKSKAEKEKTKYETLVNLTRSKTLNLQKELPNMLQAIAGFSGVCVEVLEKLHNHQNINLQQQGGKVDDKDLPKR